MESTQDEGQTTTEYVTDDTCFSAVLATFLICLPDKSVGPIKAGIDIY